MKYFRILALMLCAGCMLNLAAVNPAYAAEKSRALLQTDLDNGKYRSFESEVMHTNMTTMIDSAFNKTTDDLDDITTGTTNSLIPAADATFLATLEAGSVTTTELEQLSGTAFTSTELNRNVDDSARIVTVSGTTALTCALNGTGIVNYVSSTSAAFVGTFPAASGTGCVYDFYWQNIPTQSGFTADILQVTGNDEFEGMLFTLSDTSNAALAWAATAGADNDEMSFTSSTQFGVSTGFHIRVIDVFADTLTVEGIGNSSGSEVTPFATGQRS